ncbi:MAG TPA: translation elongation factor Ts [Actinomycetota bacterium]|nr:translation elongation factor Ts [Actinomycetota bacterium]
MAITSAQVKELREQTGAGMMDCKRALEETGGDVQKAIDLLRTKGLAAAAKRAGRVANEGVVESYIHMQGRLGVLVEVNSETDFVANTDEFRALARDIAMHIAAANPTWISREEVDPEELERERKIYEEQAREQGKPENILPKIVEGKVEAFYKERVLLDQPWIRDDKKTIGDLVTETGSKVGENVGIRRFARFKIGED